MNTSADSLLQDLRNYMERMSKEHGFTDAKIQRLPDGSIEVTARHPDIAGGQLFRFLVDPFTQQITGDIITAQ